MLTQQEKQLIIVGIQNGKSKEEIRKALINMRVGIQPQKQQVAQASQGFAGRAAETITGGGRDIKAAITGTGQYQGQSTLARATGATAEAFDIVPELAFEALPKPARQVLGKAGEVIGGAVNWLADKIGDTKTAQDFVTKHPEAAKDLENIAQIGSNVGRISGDILLAEGVRSWAKKVSRATREGITKTTDVIASEATSAGDAIAQNAQNLKIRTQKYLGGKAIAPQVESSAQRLQQPYLAGTKRVTQPVKLYDNYLGQAKKAITDIKADAPISQIGSEMGDAFRTVVKTRQAIGTKMASELEKVKNIKTNTLPVTDKFVQTLRESGLVYDRVKKSIIPVARQTKIGQADIKLLETYARELQRLGTKPTIGDIDAFLSRVNQDIKIYKSANNITGTTNGERIILQSMSGLRSQLSGTPALASYAEARKLYANYSKFIEDGERFLGKVTQSGDFAKDASLAKSSVQSILNNGKKDWIIRLEELTGQTFLDRTVLALQAMKDAGDFRGLSLLQTFSQSTPTTRNAITQKILDYALSQGAKIVAGTPEEQTRAFLNSLMQKQ